MKTFEVKTSRVFTLPVAYFCSYIIDFRSYVNATMSLYSIIITYVYCFEATMYLPGGVHTCMVIVHSCTFWTNLLSHSTVLHLCRPSVCQKQSRPTSSWCVQGWRTLACWMKWRVSPVHSFMTYQFDSALHTYIRSLKLFAPSQYTWLCVVSCALHVVFSCSCSQLLHLMCMAWEWEVSIFRYSYLNWGNKNTWI